LVDLDLPVLIARGDRRAREQQADGADEAERAAHDLPSEPQAVPESKPPIGSPAARPKTAEGKQEREDEAGLRPRGCEDGGRRRGAALLQADDERRAAVQPARLLPRVVVFRPLLAVADRLQPV